MQTAGRDQKCSFLGKSVREHIFFLWAAEGMQPMISLGDFG